jgi:SAM-dependent methyltransferase
LSREDAVFDPLAPTYDDDFTRSPIAQHLRVRVHARLDARVVAGESALELGCGTGEDALHLARRGVRLTATDASAAMLAVAQAKLRGYENVTFVQFNLSDLDHEGGKSSEFRVLSTEEAHGSETLTPHLAPRTKNTQYSELSTRNYSLVFANFGVINCFSDWQPLARWLAARVSVGGHVAFGVMSPLCAWETLWHAAHGDFRTATRRWRNGTPFTVHGSQFSVHNAKDSTHSEHRTQNTEQNLLHREPRTENREPPLIYYPSIRRLIRDFAPYFRRVHVEPLGVFLPPSDVYGVLEKRPRLLRALTRLDDSIGRWRALALLADHYWIEFRRTDVSAPAPP